MARLQIKDFSCIDAADIRLSALTILIGPQASGKSVISKLIYFFCNSLDFAHYYFETNESFADAIARAEASFIETFPPIAWGDKPFSIKYSSGKAAITVSLKKSENDSVRKCSVKFNAFLREHFTRLYADVHEALEAIKPSGKGRIESRRFNMGYQLAFAAQRELSRQLDGDFVAEQTFIPAGRSFFTTVGKSLSSLDSGSLLDPVTRSFGRTFTNLRERFGTENWSSATSNKDQHLAQDFFGGDIVFGEDAEVIETPDGRTVPFAQLSSGQQELLPLWLVLSREDEFAGIGLDEGKYQIFIEEPEAHLFPSAQSMIFAYLVKVVADHYPTRRMIITTHSPYLLTKANNLILASQVADELPNERSRIERIVHMPALLPSGSIAAYAIKDRRVISIIEKGGLVDGVYLDSISKNLSEEFLELLAIQEGFDEGMQSEEEERSQNLRL